MATTRTPVKSSVQKNAGTLFTKENHKWMIIGGVLIVLGFILMSGGKSSNPNEFEPSQVYSPLRITIAPLLVLAGLALEVFAIMKKPKDIA
jgi:Protein of unknown function (DUF3098)